MCIYVPNADETYKKALEEGATSAMEPADTPWGRFCGVKDPYGNHWWITTPPKETSETKTDNSSQKEKSSEGSEGNGKTEDKFEPAVEKKVKPDA